MAVLIHLTLQEIHIICNTKLLFVVDEGWVVIKVEEKHLRNHPKLVTAKET